MISASQYAGKNCAVIGFGRTGMSTIGALLSGGATVYGWDDQESSRQNTADRFQRYDKFIIVSYHDFPWKELDVLFLAPGIPLHFPMPHSSVKQARAAACPIIGDIELLYQHQQHAQFIAITGTNGKSTTTALIAHLLKDSIPLQCGGNIGVPVMDLEPFNKEGAFVLELSSYQIDLLDKFTADIAVFLNITPDHLDRHGSMEGYLQSKSKLFKAQGQGSISILNIDYPEIATLANQLSSRVIPISTRSHPSGGISVIDGVLTFGDESELQHLDLGVLPYLRGKHNGENIAAAFAVAYEMGVSVSDFQARLANFKGLRHRLQMVKEQDGITYINDSKGTNAEATMQALQAFENIYWLAGGIAKADGIDPLRPYFHHVKEAFLFGQDRKRLAETCEGHIPYHAVETMKGAFKKIQERLSHSDNEKAVVLLSPACASFDQWSSFEARGDAFCQWVEELYDHKSSKQS